MQATCMRIAEYYLRCQLQTTILAPEPALQLFDFVRGYTFDSTGIVSAQLVDYTTAAIVGVSGSYLQPL